MHSFNNLVSNKDNNDVPSDDCSTTGACPVEIDDEPNEEQSISQTDESAYDFIIKYMEAPEYWDEDDMPPYTIYPGVDLMAEAKKAMVNGTGWKLVDEKTATFQRGYEGILTICFSNFTAKWESGAAPHMSEGYRYEKYDLFYDYKNEIYQRIYPDGTVEALRLYQNGDSVRDAVYFPEITRDGYFNDSSMWMIKKTMLNYNQIFKLAGCPLLKEPSGTLTSYKKQKANEFKDPNEGLLKGPWQVDGFTWDYTQNKNLTWLDDFTDVLDAEVPETETKVWSDGSQGHPYSPAFLIISDLYSVENYSKDSSLKYELDYEYTTVGSAFAAYVIKPLLDKAYGYNAVYFTDMNKVLGPSRVDGFIPESQFVCGLDLTSYRGFDLLYEIEPLNKNVNESRIGTFEQGTVLGGGLDFFYEHLGSIAHKNKYDWPFVDDYFFNFKCMYQIQTQREMGLR